MTLTNGNDYAFQFDTGLQAVTTDPVGAKCRFANKGGSKAIPVEAVEYNGGAVYPIPDILLTTGRSVVQYLLGTADGSEYITGEDLLPVYISPLGR